MSTYYIEQKLVALKNRYYIYNLEGELYLEVTTKGFFAILDKVLGGIISLGHGMEIKKTDGSIFATLKKKPGVVAEKYSLYYEGTYQGEIKQHITALKPKISINTKENQYMVKGDIMGREFEINDDAGKTLAIISKKSFEIRDKYEIHIFDTDYEKLFLAAVIAIDNSIHN